MVYAMTKRNAECRVIREGSGNVYNILFDQTESIFTLIALGCLIFVIVVLKKGLPGSQRQRKLLLIRTTLFTLIFVATKLPPWMIIEYFLSLFGYERAVFWIQFIDRAGIFLGSAANVVVFFSHPALVNRVMASILWIKSKITHEGKRYTELLDEEKVSIEYAIRRDVITCIMHGITFAVWEEK